MTAGSSIGSRRTSWRSRATATWSGSRATSRRMRRTSGAASVRMRRSRTGSSTGRSRARILLLIALWSAWQTPRDFVGSRPRRRWRGQTLRRAIRASRHGAGEPGHQWQRDSPHNPGAAHVLGRAGAFRRDEPRVGGPGLGCHERLELDRVSPIVAEVVDVGKLLGLARNSRQQIAQAGATGWQPTRLSEVPIGIRFAVAYAASDAELVQVTVFPAHDDLHHPMQPIQAHVERHFDAPPDGRTYVVQLNQETCDVGCYGHCHRSPLSGYA